MRHFTKCRLEMSHFTDIVEIYFIIYSHGGEKMIRNLIGTALTVVVIVVVLRLLGVL